MRRLIYLLVTLLAMAPLAAMSAEPLATGSLKQTVYSLPCDQDKLYLTVVGSTQDRKFNDLCGLFSSTPEWTEVRDETQFTKLATNSTMFKSRYSNDYSDFPTIRLQMADGQPVKEWVGRGIPASDELMTTLKAECVRRHRQQKESKPVDKQVDQKVDSRPAPLRGEWPSWWAVLGAACFGLGLAMLQDWNSRKQYA
jgi:hypothetical protein